MKKKKPNHGPPYFLKIIEEYEDKALVEVCYSSFPAIKRRKIIFYELSDIMWDIKKRIYKLCSRGNLGMNFLIMCAARG